MKCTVRLIPAAELVVFETEKQRHSVIQENGQGVHNLPVGC
ncbi:MAG: hypothetical protein WCO99_01345 [Planctomycetota bacterium]